jgi:CheY-like chemotaxis protein
MSSFERFRQELRDALIHLNDPDYRPSGFVFAVMGCAPEDGTGPVQSEIVQVIKKLEPSAGVPLASGGRRDFDVLYNRFLLRLTQEQTAERLNLSVRSVRRAQRTATHTLARILWEHGLAREGAAEERGETATGAQAKSWRSQVKQDLAALQHSAPLAVANVEDTIHYAVELESVLISRLGVGLKTEHVEPGLVAAIHPTVLRQILVIAIGEMARLPPDGDIAIGAVMEGEDVIVTLAAPISGNSMPNDSLIAEILSSQGGSAHVNIVGHLATLSIKVRSAGRVAVLVVDDNPDMVHFYRRCTAGTRYHILHAAQGQRTADAIEAVAPDIIVLDIILPDADGWELLEQLHKRPGTRSIPVIVCSIVREENLASAFGAALYMPKPVERSQFLRALDQTLPQASAEALRNQANSAATC